MGVWVGRRAAVAIMAIALLLLMQTAPAFAAPKGQDSSRQTEKSAEVEEPETEEPETEEPETEEPETEEPETEEPETEEPETEEPETEEPETEEPETEEPETEEPETEEPETEEPETEEPETEEPETEEPETEKPEGKSGKPVNLNGKGKAAEHNPNVDAQGNLIPGSAAGKQEAEDSEAAEQAKEEKVAKVKAESREQAKAERSKGEKSAYLIYVNGKRLNLTPVAREGRTLVPFRRLAEFLGAEVSWEPSTRTVIMVKGDQKVSLSIGSSTATVNGETVDMPVAPELVEGSTFVPLRFIATALGADVDYDAETGAITVITSGEAPAPDAGGTTPAPDAGGTTPAPDAGGTTPAPDAGGTTPAPDAGGTTPAPDAGSTTPAPDATGTTPAPAPGN